MDAPSVCIRPRCQSGFQCPSELQCEQRRHRVPDLVCNIDFASFEDEVIWKRLEPRGLAHGDVAVLFRMGELAAREAVALRRNRASRCIPLQSAIYIPMAGNINAYAVAWQPKLKGYVGASSARWHVRNADAVQVRDLVGLVIVERTAQLGMQNGTGQVSYCLPYCCVGG